MRGTAPSTSATEDATPRRRPVDRVRTVVMTVAGSVGLACLLAWAAVAFTGLSFVVVTTGSMAPTIPAGGLAITHRVSAAELDDGDVVTVPRPGSTLPVTHRIVAIERVRGDAAARSLTLRGDDNTADDREPYVVRDAGLVLAHAPGLGTVLVALTSPPARGLAVAVVGVLVAWAFWPERRREQTT